MKAGLDRDRTLDKALAQAFGAHADQPASDACLDAETLAAWTEDGLDPASVAVAEAHASSCARCQALVAALARTVPEVPVRGDTDTSPWRWWLAPVAAVAAALVLWVVVPDQRYSAPPTPRAGEVAQAPTEGLVSEPRPQTTPSSPPTQATPPRPTREATRQEAAADTSAASEAKALSRERAVAGQSIALKTEAQRDIASPDPAVRWRIGRSGVVDFTTDGGQTWERTTTGVTTEIVGGTSPSPAVCWLVGHDGLVLVTSDGRIFTRVSPPAEAHLAAVQATDARSAIVTTVDGRVFQTDDGGLTWRRRE